MKIQYLEDNVTFSEPHDSQTDYQAVIEIVFSLISDDGTLQPALEYTQTITGATDKETLIQLYEEARPTITDDTLIAYAQGTPTLYVPPTPPTIGPA